MDTLVRTIRRFVVPTELVAITAIGIASAGCLGSVTTDPGSSDGQTSGSRGSLVLPPPASQPSYLGVRR
jgi:hypothetical protein